MFDKLKGRFDGQDSLSADDTTDPRRSHDSDRKSGKSPSRNSDDGRPSFQAADPPPSYPSASTDAAPPEKGAAPPFTTNFASVSLHIYDRIRLLQLPLPQRDAIRQSILQTWPRGISNEREYHGSWEFKVHGYPWAPSGDDALYARRLTRGILSTLYEAGWVLYITTDVSQNPDDKDSFFFRHQSPPPQPREWFSITFSKGDRLRLIDAPEQVVQDVVGILGADVQKHAPYRIEGVYELKLQGWPFMASGGKTMVSRNLCLKLFTVLEKNGFTVSASMDQKYGGQHNAETDTWHVSRPLGWVEGTPVYHQ